MEKDHQPGLVTNTATDSTDISTDIQ